MITSQLPWLKEKETLVCFGDSLTAAVDGYVKILTGRLGAQGHKVIGSGRGGDKTPWALTRLQTAVIDHKPDAVSIFLGTNDSAIGHGKWADEPKVTPETYRYNLMWIIYLCQKEGIKKFSITPPLYRFEGESYAMHGDVMGPYCLAAREAADEMGALFVPADIVFAEEWARHPGHTGLLLTTDGVHLTNKGNQMVADAMLKAWGMDKVV
ncbi:MAG: GDSL-type esterase/lipase family protein [Verrucomicrobiae bacterium]|nr:GDSL-type esterase/lipase family protein [Verrucomicrobiae bacterium]